MNETCGDCGALLGIGAPHECDPGEVEIMQHMKLCAEKRDAEAEVIAAADAFYDRMVNRGEGAAKRIDKAVQTLRKVLARERVLDQPSEARQSADR